MYRFEGRSGVQLVKLVDTHKDKFMLKPGMDNDERILQLFKITWALLGVCCDAPLGDTKKEVYLCDPSLNILRGIGLDCQRREIS
jgi:hypothetical protein